MSSENNIPGAKESLRFISSIGAILATTFTTFGTMSTFIPGNSVPFIALIGGVSLTYALVGKGLLDRNYAIILWLSLVLLYLLGDRILLETPPVRGKIVDVNGQPVANFEMELLITSSVARRPVSDENGIFKVENVPPGEYVLQYYDRSINENRHIHRGTIYPAWQYFFLSKDIGVFPVDTDQPPVVPDPLPTPTSTPVTPSVSPEPSKESSPVVTPDLTGTWEGTPPVSTNDFTPYPDRND